MEPVPCCYFTATSSGSHDPYSVVINNGWPSMQKETKGIAFFGGDRQVEYLSGALRSKGIWSMQYNAYDQLDLFLESNSRAYLHRCTGKKWWPIIKANFCCLGLQFIRSSARGIDSVCQPGFVLSLCPIFLVTDRWRRAESLREELYGIYTIAGLTRSFQKCLCHVNSWDEGIHAGPLFFTLWYRS